MAIQGVDTTTTVMLGSALRGPLEPRLLAGWEDFRRLYGGHSGSPAVGFLSYAVEGYFQNGGQRLYVARVVGQGAAPARFDFGGLVVEAAGPGAWGAQVYARYSPGTRSGVRLALRYYATPPGWLDLLLGRARPQMEEVFDNLTLVRGAPGGIEESINGVSRLARVKLAQDNPRRPGRLARFQPLRGGAEGSAPNLEDYTRALEAVEALEDVALIAAPDAARPELTGLNDLLVALCERCQDRFAVLSTLAGLSAPDEIEPPLPTSYAALYTPMLSVPTPGGAVHVPPVGHVAGRMVRSDLEQGVHRPPANLDLTGVDGLDMQLSAPQIEALNQRGINVIRDFRDQSRGIRIWGGRTLTADLDWKYINLRRWFLFLEQSLSRGIQYAVFEPNNEALWARVRRDIEEFLLVQWRKGVLQGTRPDQAFFVRCDRSTMTQSDLDNGRLMCLIGVAAVKPAEFVIFRIGSWTADRDG